MGWRAFVGSGWTAKGYLFIFVLRGEQPSRSEGRAFISWREKSVPSSSSLLSSKPVLKLAQLFQCTGARCGGRFRRPGTERHPRA